MKNDLISRTILDCFTPDNMACTLDHMLSACNCSPATLRRRISRDNFLVSYSHNSKFYTLSSFANFDSFGIWSSPRGVMFSKNGSLSKTSKMLVEKSKSGYTPKELASILHVRVSDLLRGQWEKKILTREKLGKEHVYYSAEPLALKSQRETRLSIAPITKKEIKPSLPNKDTIISILVAIISCESLDHAQVLKELESRGSRTNKVNLADINAVATFYGLKKTAHR